MPEKVTTDVWRSTRRHVVVISSTAVMWHRHLWRLFHNDASCCVQFYCNCIRLCARAATSTSTCSVIASEQNFKYLMGHVIIIQKFEDPQTNMLTYRNFLYQIIEIPSIRPKTTFHCSPSYSVKYLNAFRTKYV